MSRCLYIILSICTSITLFTSCTTEKIEAESLALGLEYFPIINGDRAYYEIEEVALTSLGQDTTTYTRIDSIFDVELTGAEEEESLFAQVQSYSSNTALDLDGTSKIYSITLNRTQLIRNEDDRVFIDMILPLTEENIHDELAIQIGEEERLLEVSNLGQDFEIEDTVYTDCVVIEAESVSNAINQFQYTRVYQKGVGLVYFRFLDVSQQPGQSPIGADLRQQRIAR